MTGAKFAIITAVSAVALGLNASAAAAGTGTGSGASSGRAGAKAGAGCLAHVAGGEDWYNYYTPGCTGHDEPELDPVSSAPGSARNITWRATLPADGTFPVSTVGPTFWFGGTVKDNNPIKLGGEGFLELQFYPDAFTTHCFKGGGFALEHEPNVYTACSPVWSLEQQNGNITEPAAFNGMLMNAAGSGPFVMHALDTVDVHIWAPSPNDAYQEQVTDETSGQTSSVLVLNSPGDGPLTPAFDTQQIGNALDWGAVYDTPMAFVYEIGHSDLFGSHHGDFCLPGQTFCGSFNSGNWAGQTPIRILNVTFGDGSHPQHWATVTDTGGKAEVLGHSFVGPTKCSTYGGPYCIYPWYSWDGSALNFGVNYPNTANRLGQENQFRKTTTCPAVSVFPTSKTYCDTIVR
ncbi:MAG TPA: hypothetical protein VGS62_04845 [Streptosporangiaceae bacterium]|nr:hypothetical protein [Streptosporangiaceae bacterium]